MEKSAEHQTSASTASIWPMLPRGGKAGTTANPDSEPVVCAVKCGISAQMPTFEKNNETILNK